MIGKPVQSAMMLIAAPFLALYTVASVMGAVLATIVSIWSQP